MKASEVILKLHVLIREFGDRRVKIDSGRERFASSVEEEETENKGNVEVFYID